MSEEHAPLQHREAGKGSTTRPTNHDAFSEGMDRIFGQRTKVTCPDCGKVFGLRADEPHIHTCTPKENHA